MFQPQGPKRLTLSGIDFFEHDRGVLVGRIETPALTSAWERLREEAMKIGRWPVIVGDGEVLMSSSDPESESFESILRTASAFDRDAWLNEQREILSEELRDDKEALPAYEVPKSEELDRVPPPETQFPALTELQMVEGEWITGPWIALLPTADSWKAHAYIPYGGWNAYPLPEVHVALLRGWSERFGAQLVAMDRDKIVLQVPEEVQDNAKVTELAEEQFYYCPDLVDQGHQSLAKFAADLRRHKIWTFWWD